MSNQHQSVKSLLQSNYMHASEATTLFAKYLSSGDIDGIKQLISRACCPAKGYTYEVYHISTSVLLIEKFGFFRWKSLFLESLNSPSSLCDSSQTSCLNAIYERGYFLGSGHFIVINGDSDLPQKMMSDAIEQFTSPNTWDAQAFAELLELASEHGERLHIHVSFNSGNVYHWPLFDVHTRPTNKRDLVEFQESVASSYNAFLRYKQRLNNVVSHDAQYICHLDEEVLLGQYSFTRDEAVKICGLPKFVWRQYERVGNLDSLNLSPITNALLKHTYIHPKFSHLETVSHYQRMTSVQEEPIASILRTLALALEAGDIDAIVISDLVDSHHLLTPFENVIFVEMKTELGFGSFEDVFLHESMHAVMQSTYRNDANPFFATEERKHESLRVGALKISASNLKSVVRELMAYARPYMSASLKTRTEHVPVLHTLFDCFYQGLQLALEGYTKSSDRTNVLVSGLAGSDRSRMLVHYGQNALSDFCPTEQNVTNFSALSHGAALSVLFEQMRPYIHDQGLTDLDAAFIARSCESRLRSNTKRTSHWTDNAGDREDHIENIVRCPELQMFFLTHYAQQTSALMSLCHKWIMPYWLEVIVPDMCQSSRSLVTDGKINESAVQAIWPSYQENCPDRAFEDFWPIDALMGIEK